MAFPNNDKFCIRETTQPLEVVILVVVVLVVILVILIIRQEVSILHHLESRGWPRAHHAKPVRNGPSSPVFFYVTT